MNYYDYACLNCWTRLDNFSVLILPKEFFVQNQYEDLQQENDAQQHKLVCNNLFIQNYFNLTVHTQYMTFTKNVSFRPLHLLSLWDCLLLDI